jgi:PAS domain S-box-containing protein
MRADFDEIGYGVFQPEDAKEIQKKNEEGRKMGKDGIIRFDSGTFQPRILEKMLNTLPVDITFVNDRDEVQYFSQSPERIFVRSKAVIGREVRNCHPKKSVDKVEQILNDFRAGTRDKAEFWINLGGQLIYIRYFAVRDDDGRYLGCLEVSQDLTEIKKIEGEKRLLD